MEQKIIFYLCIGIIIGFLICSGYHHSLGPIRNVAITNPASWK